MPAKRASSKIPALIVLALTIGVAAFVLLSGDRVDVGKLESDLAKSFERGDYRRAKKMADAILTESPDRDETRLLAAECEFRLNRPQQALKQLGRINDQDPLLALRGALLEARVCHFGLADFRRAEKAYLAALSFDPDSVDANTGLIQLLGVCGRRREAMPLIRRLVRLEVGSDTLNIAAREDGAVTDNKLLERAFKAYPKSSRTLVATAFQAQQFGKLNLAVQMCEQAIADDPDFAPAIVGLGGYLLALERFADLEKWSEGLSSECLEFAEAWRVRGYLAEQQGDLQKAFRCFVKAADRGPDLKDVHHRLAELLSKAGDLAASKRVAEREVAILKLESLHDRILASKNRDVPTMLEFIQQFRDLGRENEALGWAILAAEDNPTHQELLALRRQIFAGTSSHNQYQVVVDEKNIAGPLRSVTYNFDSSSSRNTGVVSTTKSTTKISFRNDAGSVGLEFEFQSGVDGPATHRMFEFTGGGVAVCDFDNDDFPDLYLSQAGLWDPIVARRNTTSDTVFRNVRGTRFENRSTEAGIEEPQFGQGVAAGDINNDGFADIYVGNIGDNTLWLNNGDGTFSKSNGSENSVVASAEKHWTTSVAIADLNADGNPDVFATNYLQGQDIFDRLCPNEQGVPRACVPTDFDGVVDSLFINDGQSGFTDCSKSLDAVGPGKSLGVAVWKPSPESPMTVLVANDTTPNMLLTLSSDRVPVVTDSAFQSGVAVNAQGTAEGCMGVAVGDITNDGLPELFVTNFYNETNTLYEAVADGIFEDKTAFAKLGRASLPMLGFGTQLIDANLDGRFELFVANGYIDDLRSEGKAYHMPAQMFQHDGRVFNELATDGLGDYFADDHLGRAVALIDWNVDGLQDIAVGHLAENYALLTNTSERSMASVAVRFLGTRSSRDAIGVTVAWSLGQTVMTRQLTAGDGYHSSNEHQLTLPIDERAIDTLSVLWPSGLKQQVRGLKSGQRYVICEDRASSFALP